MPEAANEKWDLNQLAHVHSVSMVIVSLILESLDGDLSKAFDSVPHLIPLLNKLKQIGLNPFITKWTESYLSGRLQLVVLDGVESSLLPVLSGVPQGSILGPLLFLIYIDKAANCVSSSSIAMYADDIALYRSISS